jgi:hypothetical protein
MGHSFGHIQHRSGLALRLCRISHFATNRLEYGVARDFGLGNYSYGIRSGCGVGYKEDYLPRFAM